ncbi:hypothetical protein [Halorarius litoreus]|uniref:hypothetical protein n=1 Tax=Halorarius litoreus TaxID=2962676 RepID=UPI0020CCC94C|nr:hypothetical protein [Halorarius litoreus]
MPERLDLEHDLPDALREAVRDETRSLGTLYNAVQDLDDATFAERFESAHAAFTDALTGTDADFVIAVVGIEVSEDPTDMIASGALLSVHEPNDDGSVKDLLFTGDAGIPDTVVMLPIRPADCPPDSGEQASDLSMSGFREVLAAMVYMRFNLLQNDLDAYRDSYLRPTVRGLEAYADAAL